MPTMSETSERPSTTQAIIDHLPEGLPRRIIDGLSEMRIMAGPPLALQLLKTSAEDRTWAEGAITAGVAITDKFDGLGAELIGPTEYGRELDRKADRRFVTPQQGVLMLNGEIPPIHFGLKIAREAAMKGLRRWGAEHGKDLKSLQVNRQKTTFEMATLTAAHSPLAKHEDLIRWGASAATALSLTGLIETAFDYMKKDDSEETTDNARNSHARQASAGPIGNVATFINENAPGISPGDVTKWGKRLVVSAAGLAMARPDKPVLATTIYTVGSLFDSFDGSLAREKGEDSDDGMIEDVEADLEQQIVTFAALCLIAQRRHNKVAAANYALAAMTTSLSALTRAEAEAQGYIVAEGGMGTRLGRGILGGVGMGLNKHRDLSDIVSATVASANINTVLERRDVVQHGADSKYCVGQNDDPKFKEQAEKRKEAIMPYAKRGLAAGSALLALNNAV